LARRQHCSIFKNKGAKTYPKNFGPIIILSCFGNYLDQLNDAACSCGAPREDAFHYLFTCPNYTEIRLIMMNNLNWVQTSDLNLLTCGSDDLTYEENINIFKHLFNLIKSSKRFLVV
jgi:hypothetical protein